MFKLIEIFTGLFAVVKANKEESKFPVNAHAFLEVINRNSDMKVIVLKGKMSQELSDSGELESLKKEAIELTKETLYGEFRR